MKKKDFNFTLPLPENEEDVNRLILAFLERHRPKQVSAVRERLVVQLYIFRICLREVMSTSGTDQEAIRERLLSLFDVMLSSSLKGKNIGRKIGRRSLTDLKTGSRQRGGHPQD